MSVVKISWSGGKDSTCAFYKHLELGNKVKAVCYVPMFTDDIPLLLKSHYNFIISQADEFRKLGAEVSIVSGITYWNHTTRIIKRGENKGKMAGFPCFLTGRCCFKRDSKVSALNKYDVGYYDYEDIGIAVDEVKRHKQLNDKKRSILFELGITENTAKQYCIEKGAYSPNYELKKRDGCALCPHASESERQAWYNDYPQAVPLLLELENLVKAFRPEHYPLREGKWFLNN